MEIDRSLLQGLPLKMQVEIEENICRKDFTETELGSIQEMLIAHFSKPENKRQGQRTDLTCTENSVQVPSPYRRGNATEKVAKSTLNVLIPWEYCSNIFKIHDLGPE